jgi:hypothetical protein
LVVTNFVDPCRHAGFGWKRSRIARSPAPLTVTSTADAGLGTLRDAISKANLGDQIVFALPNHSTISLTSGSLDVTKTLMISGPGPSALTISGNHSFSVFSVSSANTFATISGLKITGGGGQNGGGIENDAFSLALFNCVISGNFASMGGGGNRQWSQRAGLGH